MKFIKNHKAVFLIVILLIPVIAAAMFRTGTIYRMAGISPVEPVKGNEVGLYVLDTGQAQSVIVRTAKSSVLIDCGGCDDASKVVFAANMLGIDEFDAVIISHTHYDHAGGVSGVLKRKHAGTLYMDNAEKEAANYDSATYDSFSETDDGDTALIGDIKIEFIICEGDEDKNESSVVCKVDASQLSALILSDIGSKAQNELLSSSRDVKADIMTAPHHGSAYSTNDEFLRAVSPKAVIVSAGADNSYSLPSKKYIDSVNEYGTELFRTDIDSDISVIKRDGKYRVYTSDIHTSWEVIK